MKRIIKLLFISLMVVALVACNKKDTKQTETPNDEKKSKISIGFVTDVGGIDDKSFNQTTYEGILKYAKENGLEEGKDLKYLQSKTDTDYIPNLTAFAEEGVDLVVAAGYLFTEAINETAKKYPDQKILIIDVNWLDGDHVKNVQQATFSEHEGSFLVGVATALKAKAAGKDTVGIILGNDSDTMKKFEAGYQAGVLAVCPECKILFDNANSFDNPEIGKTLAIKQFNAGAYAIYAAAGGTGIGSIQEAASRRANGEDVWLIGVDTDQYNLGVYGEEGKSAILTSMLKKVDVAAYDALKEIADGTFKGKKIEYTLKDGGVDLPKENPNLEAEIIKEVENYKAKIISGEISVPKKPSPYQN